MDSKEELAEIARMLRTHVEWLGEQGVEGLPEAEPVVLRPATSPATSTSAPPSTSAAEPEPEAPPPPVAQSPATEPAPPATAGTPERRSLSEIRAELGDCTRCRLHERRNSIVYGVGNPNADIMFVGEGPGRDEDLQGEPFVGAAGQLLTKIIGAMGLRREEVYIANVVKCRPPQNRTPEADEVAACSPFLFAQIESIRPEIIVGLGKPACATLVGASLNTSITRMRGRWLEFRGRIPLMPTFHPAYLLRNPAAKRDVWEDIKRVAARYEELTGRRLQLASGRGKEA